MSQTFGADFVVADVEGFEICEAGERFHGVVGDVGTEEIKAAKFRERGKGSDASGSDVGIGETKILEIGESGYLRGAGVVDGGVGGIQVFDCGDIVETGAFYESVVDREALEVLQRGQRREAVIGDHGVAEIQIAEGRQLGDIGHAAIADFGGIQAKAFERGERGEVGQLGFGDGRAGEIDGADLTGLSAGSAAETFDPCGHGGRRFGGWRGGAEGRVRRSRRGFLEGDLHASAEYRKRVALTLAVRAIADAYQDAARRA